MKSVQIRRSGETYKAAPNNYNRTKTAFGAYWFPIAEFEQRMAAAQVKGYQVEIVDVPERHHHKTAAPKSVAAPINHQYAGIIDHEKGVLKCPSTSYVVDCVSLRLVPVERARFIGVSKGFPYWITEGDDLAEADVIYPSVFGDKNPRDFPRRIAL